MLPLDIFESRIHRARDLVEFHAPGSCMQGGLETETVEFLVRRKAVARL
jgi:hypothetical protein